MNSCETFFYGLRGIQDIIIVVTPSIGYRGTEKKISNTEELLDEAIVWLIVKMMELFDGIKNDIQYEIKNTKSNIVLNSHMGYLHDMFDSYLFYDGYEHDNKEIDMLFEQLAKIRTEMIEFGLKKEKLYKSYTSDFIPFLLETISYRTIYRIMELFDGESGNKIRYEIRDTKNNIILNDSSNVKLHSLCWKYLI